MLRGEGSVACHRTPRPDRAGAREALRTPQLAAGLRVRDEGQRAQIGARYADVALELCNVCPGRSSAVRAAGDVADAGSIEDASRLVGGTGPVKRRLVEK